MTEDSSPPYSIERLDDHRAIVSFPEFLDDPRTEEQAFPREGIGRASILRTETFTGHQCYPHSASSRGRSSWCRTLWI